MSNDITSNRIIPIDPAPRGHRRRHVPEVALVLALLACTTTGALACDPKNPRCANAPPHAAHIAPEATATSNLPPGAGPAAIRHPQPIVEERKPSIGPVAPGPLHANAASSSAKTQHGIIFVGGKPSNDKAALNPQPIPPGRGARPNARLRQVAPRRASNDPISH